MPRLLRTAATADGTAVRVLLISNMYPSPEKPYAGIFVRNQFEYLRASDTETEYRIFYMPRRFTSAAGSVVKYVAAALRFLRHLFVRYDVVHVHYVYPLYALAWVYKAMRRRTRIVVTFHGGDVFTKLANERVRRVFAARAGAIDYAIAVGAEVAATAAERLQIRVDEVLSAGVDRRTFRSIPGTEKRYDFLFAGSFVERKGVDLLLDGMALLDRDVRMCFVGSGPLREDIERFARGRAIEILGTRSQSELCVLYNQARFLILPSRNEPFGLVVTEALYCGTPAIVSSAGGLREQIVDGANGFVLESLAPAAIATAMSRCCQLSTDDYQGMSNAAAMSNSSYSLEFVCGRLTEVYHALASFPRQFRGDNTHR